MHEAYHMKTLQLHLTEMWLFCDNLLRSHGVLLNAKCYLLSQ